MNIRNSDVKLSEGQRLTDVVDGGGRVTADTPRPIGRGFLDRSKKLPASSRLP